MPIEFVKDSWPGAVREVTIGATSEDGGTRVRTITVSRNAKPAAGGDRDQRSETRRLVSAFARVMGRRSG